MILSARGVGLINGQAFPALSVTMRFILEDRECNPCAATTRGHESMCVCVCVCMYFTAVARDLHVFHYPQSGQRPPGGEPWVSLTIASSMYKQETLARSHSCLSHGEGLL